MLNWTFINFLAFITIYLGVYAVVDRICNCFERCSLAKNVGRTMKKSGQLANNDEKSE